MEASLSLGAPDPADEPASPEHAAVRPRRDNPRLGIALMILTSLVFACQDGMSRYLGSHYSVITVVMIRYWFFALFVLTLASAQKGGIRRVARTGRLGLQIVRGILLVVEICATVLSFVVLGLIGTHAIFATYPLLVAALAGPVLRERVGWRRRVAIGIGLLGVLVILRPGFTVFSAWALVPFAGALLFAIYALLTRLVGRTDSAETSLFYTGIAGAVAITAIGPFFWTPIQGAFDWFWMLTLCAFGVLGHFTMIKAYELAEAGTIQPFAYFQLVWVTIMALFLFGERPDRWTVAGAALILGAGIYTLVRQARLRHVPE
jgi:drug/metabolite transporter (DMT)-like permease